MAYRRNRPEQVRVAILMLAHEGCQSPTLWHLYLSRDVKGLVGMYVYSSPKLTAQQDCAGFCAFYGLAVQGRPYKTTHWGKADLVDAYVDGLKRVLEQAPHAEMGI